MIEDKMVGWVTDLMDMSLSKLWELVVDYSIPGFLVLHYLPEFAQTHVHCVGDAIQLSHPVTTSPLALTLSQHQGLF